MSELKFICRSFQVCDALNFKEDSPKCAVLTWGISRMLYVAIVNISLKIGKFSFLNEFLTFLGFCFLDRET